LDFFNLIFRIALHQYFGILIVPEQTAGMWICLRKYTVALCEQD